MITHDKKRSSHHHQPSPSTRPSWHQQSSTVSLHFPSNSAVPATPLLTPLQCSRLATRPPSRRLSSRQSARTHRPTPCPSRHLWSSQLQRRQSLPHMPNPKRENPRCCCWNWRKRKHCLPATSSWLTATPGPTRVSHRLTKLSSSQLATMRNHAPCPSRCPAPSQFPTKPCPSLKQMPSSLEREDH